MPTELLSFPPAYSAVGLYRLLTDPSIREPVFAKVKHATVRGAIVSSAYAILGWGIMDWVVKKFILRGKTGSVTLGHGSLSINIDLLLCKLAPVILGLKTVPVVALTAFQIRICSSSYLSSDQSCASSSSRTSELPGPVPSTSRFRAGASQPSSGARAMSRSGSSHPNPHLRRGGCSVGREARRITRRNGSSGSCGGPARS